MRGFSMTWPFSSFTTTLSGTGLLESRNGFGKSPVASTVETKTLSTSTVALMLLSLPVATEGSWLVRPTRFAHYGPVVAGGRVIVASSDGALRLFDPVSGALTAQVELPDGAASAPVVAGGVLYVIDRDGTLRAFR